MGFLQRLQSMISVASAISKTRPRARTSTWRIAPLLYPGNLTSRSTNAESLARNARTSATPFSYSIERLTSRSRPAYDRALTETPAERAGRDDRRRTSALAASRQRGSSYLPGLIPEVQEAGYLPEGVGERICQCQSVCMASAGEGLEEMPEGGQARLGS
jgi:hypothetical protein